jgi:adenosylcobinamide-GDP ribazoletransferase
MLKKFLAALSFLTIIPFKPVYEGSISGVMVYFPLVGLFIGCLSAAVNTGLERILPHSVSTALTLCFYVVLTGMLHLDGFADSLDGIFGGKDKNERLRIMSGELLGTYAVCGLFFLLLLKYLLLNALLETDVKTVWLFMPLISRWTPVFMFAVFNPAKSTGLAAALKSGLKKYEMLLASVFTAGCAYLILGYTGILILALAALLALAAGMFGRKKVGGITGDISGAAVEVTELIVLLSLCIAKI